MRGQPPGGGVRTHRPPVKTPFREALVAEPEPLTVVDEHLHGGASSIPKAKNHTGKGILPQRVFAQPHEPVDAVAKIGRLDGHQNLHLRRDRKHHWESRTLRPTATISVAS